MLENSFVYAGKNVTQNEDKLVAVSLKYLYNAIKQPKNEIVAIFNRLKIVKDIDRKRFNSCKRELPYFVCGRFNPAHRKNEYFMYSDYFILDIDKIESKGLDLSSTRERIEKDSRVLMSFISPSEEGLKLIFKFKERCYDSGVYSAFYKRFADSFSQQYGLDQVIDKSTSDVSRACFISIDPNVYINVNADAVDINDYIDFTSDEHLFKQNQSLDNQNNETPEHTTSDEELDRIKDILKIKKTSAKAKENPVYVPEQLNNIIDGAKQYLEEAGLTITEILNISYGKKIRAKLGIRNAEVNLFFGKRGFSIVKSPKCGTNPELNDIMCELLKTYIDQL